MSSARHTANTTTFSRPPVRHPSTDAAWCGTFKPSNRFHTWLCRGPLTCPEPSVCCSIGTLTNMASRPCSVAVDHLWCGFTHLAQLKQCLSSAPLGCGCVARIKSAVCGIYSYRYRYFTAKHKHETSAPSASVPPTVQPTVKLEATTTSLRALHSTD